MRDDARPPLRGGAAPRLAPRAPEAHVAHEVLTALRTAVAAVDGDWRIRYANAAWSALGDGGVGRSLWTAVPALRGEPAEPLLRATAADGRARGVRIRPRHADAPWWEVRVCRGSAGSLLIEAREAATPGTEPARILEALGEAVIAVDPTWQVTHWSTAAERVTGLRRGETLGRPLWDVWPEALGTSAERAWRETMSSREPREVVGDPAEGTSRGARFDGRSVPLDGGGVAIVLGRGGDEARIAAELADVRGENDLLRELSRHLAAVPDAERLFVVLGETVLRECGGCGAGLNLIEGSHVRVLAAIGRGLPEPGTTFPLANSLTERVAAQRRVLRRRGYRATSAEVQRIFEAEGVEELMLAPLVAYDRTVGILSAVRRASDAPFGEREERRMRLIADSAAVAVWKSRLLDEAHAANRAKSNFLAAVSHELRTPLTALAGYGELLTDEIVGPLTVQQQDVVERMRSVTHHLTATIDEILTFSSLEAGRERVLPGEVASGDVLRAAAAVIEPLAHGRGLDFTLELPPDAPAMVTDPDKVRQILVNLGSNAVKFTERGVVTMGVRAEGDMVRFSVRDTGIGIAPEDRPRLFHAFTQLDASLTRRYGGTGLGLHISDRLARLLGGRIDVTSEPGRGSTFELVLPRG